MDAIAVTQLIALASGVKLTATDDRAPTGQYAQECDQCIHRREVPGNAHIACGKPCPRMSGDRHGIANGWFMYPTLFDPTWRTSDCANFVSKDAVSPAVSGAISQVS